MTPEQALSILSDALQPAMIGKISRSGYVAIEEAVRILSEALKTIPSHDPQP